MNILNHSQAHQGSAAVLTSQGSLGSQATTTADASAGHVASTAGRCARQRQETSGCLISLPVELLEHILSFVDKSSWPALYRTCKRWHDWVATQAAAQWSKQVQTRLLLYWDRPTWWWPMEYYSGEWTQMQTAHTPNYIMVQHPQLLQFIQAGRADASELKRIIAHSYGAVKLHVSAAKEDSVLRLHDTKLVYMQSWLVFPLNPLQACPAVAACFSHITTIRLQDVRLTHPLPECIRQVCTSLHSYSLQDVVWPEQVAPGKPWPQLQQLAYGSSTAATSTGFMTAQLPQLMNPNTLPSLHILCIATWPDNTPVSPLVACCAAFSGQLTKLRLGENIALGAVLSGPWFSRTPSTPILPQLTELEVRYEMGDDDLDALLAAAPALQRLRVQVLQLSRSHAHIQCQLTHLEVRDTPDLEATLAGLPRTPMLKHLKLPMYTVQGQGHSEQQVAAAVSAVQHLGKVQGYLGVSFWPRIPASKTHMQTLGPLLQVLCQKLVAVGLLSCSVDRFVLDTFGAAAVPEVHLTTCRWDPPDVLDQVWALMPHTSKVR